MKAEDSEQPKHLYEYSVIRVVPDVERGECVNVGLLMMCKRLRKVWVRLTDDLQAVSMLCPDCDTEALGHQLVSFVTIGGGHPEGGPLAGLPAEERFRWLTAVRSTIVQTSRPHPGESLNPDVTFEELYSRLVKR